MEDKQGVFRFVSSFFFILASCKYPAKALRRVLLGSQDVNNFLPVAKETLSNTEPPVPSPMVTVHSVKEGFLFPDLALVQSQKHLCIRLLHGPGDPQHLGVVSISTGGGGGLPSEPFKGSYFSAQLCSCAEGACLTAWLTQAEALMYQRKIVNVRWSCRESFANTKHFSLSAPS